MSCKNTQFNLKCPWLKLLETIWFNVHINLNNCLKFQAFSVVIVKCVTDSRTKTISILARSCFVLFFILISGV